MILAWASPFNHYNAEILLHKLWRPHFFQFEIIINVLVLPPHMLWVYGSYHYFISFSAETVFRLCLENGPLYKNGPRTEKVNLWHRI